MQRSAVADAVTERTSRNKAEDQVKRVQFHKRSEKYERKAQLLRFVLGKDHKGLVKRTQNQVTIG